MSPTWYEEIFEIYLEDERFHRRADDAIDKHFKKWLVEEEKANSITFSMTFRWSSWSKFVNEANPRYRVTLR